MTFLNAKTAAVQNGAAHAEIVRQGKLEPTMFGLIGPDFACRHQLGEVRCIKPSSRNNRHRLPVTGFDVNPVASGLVANERIKGWHDNTMIRVKRQARRRPVMHIETNGVIEAAFVQSRDHWAH